MTSVMKLRAAQRGTYSPAEVRDAVWIDGAVGGTAVAYVEVDSPGGYLRERKQGIRRFRLWSDKNRSALLATVTTSPGATKRDAQYAVQGAGGEPLTRVTVRKASWTRWTRTRWTIELPGLPPAEARKGRVVWWVVWWLTSPIQALVVVLSVLGGIGDVARMPMRTVWRVNGQPILDYHSDNRYIVQTETLHPVTAAAIVALHRSRPAVLETAWDELTRKS